MSFTKVYRGSRGGFEATCQALPLLKTSVDHPNPTYISSKFSLNSPRVASPRRKSSTTANIAGGDSVAGAKDGVNGGVPVVQPSEESPVILRLMEILSMKSDQTVMERLDNVDLDSLPEVERLLESSHVRYDYDLTARSLLITMASYPHECGVRAMRNLFEPRMNELTAKYGGVWNYDTNLRFHLFERNKGIPMSSTFTPDGGISGVSRDLTLAVEIAASEQLTHAREKIRSYLSSRSVIAGIILNLDENPAFASPDSPNDWDSHLPFVDFANWSSGEICIWGPRHFAGHRWGGVYTCQIEVYWPRRDGSTRSYKASLVPLDNKENLDTINEELAAVWKYLVETHFRGQVDQVDVDSSDTPFLDINGFRRALSLDLHKAAHQRYSDAWNTANRQRESLDESDEPDDWDACLAAIEARLDDRDRARKRRRVA